MRSSFVWLRWDSPDAPKLLRGARGYPFFAVRNQLRTRRLCCGPGGFWGARGSPVGLVLIRLHSSSLLQGSASLSELTLSFVYGWFYCYFCRP